MGRIFPRLPPFAGASPALEVALLDIGKPGGILDANDDLAAGPVALIVDPALSLNNPNNPVMTAGATFMGQFMDHDMTFDLSSRLGVPTEPLDSPNARTPAFDLDSVYGGGPVMDPDLYVPVPQRSREQPIKLRIESGGVRRPASSGGWERCHRRPAQRREPHHRRPPRRVHPVPQPGRGRRGRPPTRVIRRSLPESASAQAPPSSA